MSDRRTTAFIAHHDGDDVAMAVLPGVGEGAQHCWIMQGDRMLDITARQAIPLGHKVALRDIRQGDTVLKYGVSIGAAACDIRAGEHVHTHNLRSQRW